MGGADTVSRSRLMNIEAVKWKFVDKTNMKHRYSKLDKALRDTSSLVIDTLNHTDEAELGSPYLESLLDDVPDDIETAEDFDAFVELVFGQVAQITRKPKKFVFNISTEEEEAGSVNVGFKTEFSGVLLKID